MQSSRVAECQQTAERRTTCSIACRGYGDSRTRCSHRESRDAGDSRTRCSHRKSREREGRTRRSHRVSRDAQRVKNKMQSSRVAGERRKNKTMSSRVAEETKRSHRESRKRQAAVIACRGMSAEGRTRRSHRVSRVRGSRTSCSQRVSRDRGKKNKLQSSRVAECQQKKEQDAVIAWRGIQEIEEQETDGAVTCWSSAGFGLWRFGSPWPSCIGESG
jgi:hypothetical protein